MVPEPIRQRAGDGAHAAAGKAELSELTVELPHRVVTVDVRGPWGRRPTPDRDHPEEREESLQVLGLEVAIEQIAR